MFHPAYARFAEKLALGYLRTSCWPETFVAIVFSWIAANTVLRSVGSEQTTLTKLTAKLREVHQFLGRSEQMVHAIIRALVGSGHLAYSFRRSEKRMNGIEPRLFANASELHPSEPFIIFDT